MMRKIECGSGQKLKFVTLFPDCTNTEIIKDVGQIPYWLAKKFRLDSSLVSCRVEPGGEYIAQFPELKVKKIPGFLGSSKMAGFVYILLNAKKIDWLNIYHFGRCTLYWGKLYKLLNKEGKIYRRFDMNYRSCRDVKLNFYKRKIFQKCIKQADIVSVESRSVISKIEKYADKNIAYIPSGYTEPEIIAASKFVRNKENIFITVGRLGIREKATEILLEAFAKVADTSTLRSWNLVLVGSIEKDFEVYIERFYQKYPLLKERVVFTGNIASREKLFSIYEKAKVMILPSRSESFGIVLVEALSRGCRIIGTKEIPPIKEIINDGKYGYSVAADDVDGLAKAMVRITEHDYSEDAIEEISQYAKDRFSWGFICEQLYSLMVATDE